MRAAVYNHISVLYSKVLIDAFLIVIHMLPDLIASDVQKMFPFKLPIMLMYTRKPFCL